MTGGVVLNTRSFRVSSTAPPPRFPRLEPACCRYLTAWMCGDLGMYLDSASSLGTALAAVRGPGDNAIVDEVEDVQVDVGGEAARSREVDPGPH
jgi:hypothetical protein